MADKVLGVLNFNTSGDDAHQRNESRGVEVKYVREEDLAWRDVGEKGSG
jgi:hypothetical protein